MYPTVYHFFLDQFNLEIPAFKLINSFGLFVALAFVGAAYFLRKEMDRKQALGHFQSTTIQLKPKEKATPFEYIVQGLIGFVIGWKFLFLIFNAGELFQSGLPQSHLFSLEGNVVLGVLIAAGFIAWKYWENKSASSSSDSREIQLPASHHVGSIVMVAAVGGIIGAKFFHLLEYPEELVQFFRAPSLSNFLGGLTIYGGLIVGGLAVYFFARRTKINFLHLADATAPGLMLAYGIGRIGCQVSGDGDWGIPNTNPKPSFMNWLPDWMWSYSFPNNVNGVLGPRQAGYTGKLIEQGDPWPIFQGYGTYLHPGVYPTAFYETIMALCLFGLLWGLRKKIKIPGQLFAIYCMVNGIERFLIEKIRVNVELQWFQEHLNLAVTQAELISVVTFTAGCLLWVWLKRK